MKKTILFTLFILASAAVSAQQSIGSENVDKFRAISLNGNITTELIPADANKVDITLHDADITKFKWSVKDGTLGMNLNSGGKSQARADVKIFYADTLNLISVSGGQIRTTEPVQGVVLRVELSAGARATAEFDVIDLEFNVNGNSAAQFSGDTKYLYARATEKSKVDARNLYAESVEAEAATGAELTVNASERLVVNSKTTATIFYKGHPSIIKDRTSKMNSGLMGSSVLNIGD